MKLNKVKLISILTMLILSASPIFSRPTKAVEEGYAFAVSPMTEKLLLNPGDQYSSSISVYSPVEYTMDVKYEITTAGFYINEDNKNIYEECVDRCDMADWITINSSTEGRLSPGDETRIEYTINVPKDAHGGGQYASIIVKGEAWSDETDESGSQGDGAIKSAINEKKRIAYTIYAEITGDVIKQGQIIETDVPSFLLSGNIRGSSSIKNTGNVHGAATYKLQVFPLFSNEEVYTNEENPATKTILPDRTLYNETAWENTPVVGIFNVVYTVEFEGVTAQVKKMVIICPLWLLFVIVFVVLIALGWLVTRARSRKHRHA